MYTNSEPYEQNPHYRSIILFPTMTSGEEHDFDLLWDTFDDDYEHALGLAKAIRDNTDNVLFRCAADSVAKHLEAVIRHPDSKLAKKRLYNLFGIHDFD